MKDGIIIDSRRCVILHLRSIERRKGTWKTEGTKERNSAVIYNVERLFVYSIIEGRKTLILNFYECNLQCPNAGSSRQNLQKK